ncbi:MAG: AMP-binding protein [Sphingomonas sp.]|uniref:class I adenylate-forming enzyme family protein n=1 Tax=Sphingomonas sp. TaxID=28214 RepID=UPI001AC0A516|nr:AMP-binding protein [Sphingomonas sp.]MBN8816022.1 AMP-binding protein [Sphingomonas sp.]
MSGVMDPDAEQSQPNHDEVFGRADFGTVVDMFWDAVDVAGGHIALIEGERTLSYRDYGAAVAALAARLAAIGVSRERVAILVPNSIEANVAIYAALAAGAQVALLNPGYGADELAPLIDIARPKVIIAGADGARAARGLAAAHRIDHVLAVGEGDLSTPALVAQAATRPAVRIDRGDLATLLFTGGTTGVPKGVDRPHGTLVEIVHGMHQAWPTRIDQEVWLNVAPVFHVWGSLMGCLNPVYCRSPVVIISRYQPDLVLAALERHRVTVFSGGPAAIYVGLLAAAGIDRTDLSSLRICPGGGSPFLMETLTTWYARTGVPILEAFGMTEGGPICANPTDGTHRFGTVGRPLPGLEVSIAALDDPERTVPTGELGEIRIRGSRVVHAYRGQGAGRADGWLYTGDVGVFDADGYLRLVDRTKDMLIVGGFNVYPREIEEVLARHPAVAEAAVVGTPDARKGEVPVAFARLRDGATASPTALADYCAAQLVAYKRPRSVTLMNMIPKTPANKICRKTLAALAAGQQPTGESE